MRSRRFPIIAATVSRRTPRTGYNHKEETMRRLLLAALLVAGVGLAHGAAAQQKQNLSIVTGGTGGVYYPLGGGLATLLSKYVPGWQATAEVTGGSVDNLKLIGAGRADIAFTMADASLDAQKGEDKFKGQPVKQKTLAVLYPNRMHVVTVDGTGINRLADLKGKRVSTGSQGSATEVMAFRVLEAAGLDKDKDIRRERLGVAESTNAMKDRKIDAYFWVGGVPTAAVTDLAATPGTKIKLIDHADLVDKMNAKYGPLYSGGAIKAGSYPNQTADNRQANVWNILVAAEKMSDQTAYGIVKTIFEHKAEWEAVHKSATEVVLENQKRENSPVAFHPGAMKYFAEKGIKLAN
jgi:TRAP transporter TAXI family solute receptor